MDTHKVTQLEITGIPLKSAMSDATREWRSGIEDLGVRRPEDSALEIMWGHGALPRAMPTGRSGRYLQVPASPHLYNVCYYSNPIVDKDFESGLATADAKRRAVAYADAQKRIWEDEA